MNSLPVLDQAVQNGINLRIQELSEVPDGAIIYLSGHLDTHSTPFFTEKLAEVIEAGFTKIVFHCAQVNYISSTGVGALVGVVKRVKELDGDVVLAELQPKVNEVFKLLGFGAFLNFSSDFMEAAKRLQTARRSKV